jgi:glutamyl-tRNA(Gln) amidotransferase subunit E
VLVWGNGQDATAGANEIIIRAKEATIGVPSETRQALRDGTNGFERILPGPDRMYPDTDLPPRRITREHLARIATTMPRPFWERELWYNELRLPRDIIAPLAISPFAGLFERAVKEWGLPPVATGVALTQLPKRISRSTPPLVPLTVAGMEEILKAWRDGLLVREGILPALAAMAAGIPFDRTRLPGPCSRAELDAAIQRARVQLAATTLHQPGKANHVLLALIMQQLRGRIDGRSVAQVLNDGVERSGT